MSFEADRYLTTEPERPGYSLETDPWAVECECGKLVSRSTKRERFGLITTRWTEPKCEICGGWLCDDCTDESLGYPVHKEGCLAKARERERKEDEEAARIARGAA